MGWRRIPLRRSIDGSRWTLGLKLLLLTVFVAGTNGGAWERLSVGGGVNYQSTVTGYGIAHPTLGTTTVTQGAYALLNLHATYQLNERFSLGLSIRNALDKTYWTNLDYPNYGDPRSVMLSVRGRF